MTNDDYLQNDPDRAGGLIVTPPGGVFDPRAFRDRDEDGDRSAEPVKLEG